MKWASRFVSFFVINATIIGCATTPPEAYSFVIIPDTQNYTKYEKNQDNFVVMTQWVVDHLDEHNIVLVLHEGDLVEQNAILEGGGQGLGDQTGLEQWAAAKRAISVLDGHVPYILCTGNHDYGMRNAEDRQTHFNTFFGAADNPLNSDGQGGGILRGMGPNAFGAHTLENAYFELEGPDGRDFLIVVVEFGPREQAVQWAKRIADRPAFADHTAVLLTHTYLSHNDAYDASPFSYPIASDTHGGQELWDELVGPSTNFEFVFNGHIGGDQIGYRVDTNAGGRAVHQMLFNAQFDGGGSGERGNGGDGWLRLVTFEPDGKTVTIRTYSPLRDARGDEPWRTDAANQFEFEITPLR
ncbi:MAG: serine/threonine protein phosphatase [Planctomycetota bacterium]